jgi:hypothetical protein
MSRKLFSSGGSRHNQMKASAGTAADDAGLGRLPGRDQVRGQNHIDTGYGVKQVAAQKKITCNDQV